MSQNTTDPAVHPADPAVHSVGAVLSILQPTMLCDIDDIARLLAFMLGRPVWTHMLPDAAELALPYIKRQCPELVEAAAIVPDDWATQPGWPDDTDQKKAYITAWLEARVHPTCGTDVALYPVPERYQP